MTENTTNNASAAAGTGGSNLFNTAAGWVLFAAALGLGLSILSGKYFHGDNPQRPEQLGYVIEGVAEAAAGPAEVPIAVALAAMPAAELIAAGEKAYAKCQSCHTINPGGANGIGPNLAGVMGGPVAGVAGFAYSAEMKALGGQWTWEKMDAWLKNPRALVAGTRMNFAGLSKVEDRAAISAFLNAKGANMPFPAPPAAEAAPADGAAPTEGEVAAPADAETAVAAAAAE